MKAFVPGLSLFWACRKLAKKKESQIVSHHRHLPQTHSLQQGHLGSPGNAVIVVVPASSSAGAGDDTLVLPWLPMKEQSEGSDLSKEQ